jgi:hypothetical protein
MRAIMGQLMTETVDPDVLSALASVVEGRGWVPEIEAMRIASARVRGECEQAVA